jgi:hypothetical protein
MNQHIPLKKCLNYFIALLFLCLIISEKSFAIPKVFSSAGNWSNAALWSPVGVPGNGDGVTINATCTVDVATAIISSLTVNSNITLTIANSAIADLSLSGPIVVYTGGKIDNQGYFNLQGTGNQFQLQGTATYIHNPRVAEEQIFINSTEDFSATSTLVIMKWFDEAIPLGSPNRVSPSNPNYNFGNVILNVPGVIWDQDGYFQLRL